VDTATIVGIVSGFILICSAMMMGGDLSIFWHPPSILITVGGTITATLMSYRLSTFMDLHNVAKKAFTTTEVDIEETINTIVRLAEKARRDGLLTLDDDADRLDDPFLQKGIQLIVDGNPRDLVRNILETEVTFAVGRHRQGQSVFETLASYAPAFGMLGTLIGLVQMLTELDSPESVGPGMAVALITTFYGSLLANMVFLPIAQKLKVISEREVFVKETIIEGVLAIQAGDNPRIVQEKLKSFLSPKERQALGNYRREVFTNDPQTSTRHTIIQ
jgi:chemotaxis protein MotA